MSKDNSRAIQITEALTHFITLDDQPLSVVDNVGFRRLLEVLEPCRNSDASLFRRLNGPKYFPLDRHATMPTVKCSENGTHWSEGPFVRLFQKEAIPHV